MNNKKEGKMSKSKIVIIVFLVVILIAAVIVMPGCKKNTATTTTAAMETTTTAAMETTKAAAETTEAEKKITKIGYSPLSTQMEYFQRVILGMQSTCDKNGIELMVNDPQMKLDKQVSGLEDLLTAGAQSLVICSLDPVAVETAIDEAHKKGVSVISHVSSFKGADTYVGLDEYKFGTISGETFAKKAFDLLKDKKIKAAILNADTLGEGLLKRKNGQLDALKKVFTDFEIVADATAFDEQTALTTVETMLQAHPDINVIVTENDEGAFGVVAAVEAAGKKLNQDIFICCLGDEFKTLDLIEQGKILSSASVSPELTGQIMVEKAIEIFNGEKVDLNVYVENTGITTENVKEVRDFKLSFGPKQ